MRTLLLCLFISFNLLSFEKEDTKLSSILKNLDYQEIRLERTTMGQFTTTIVLGNGKKIRVLIDSGAGKTIFDSTFMRDNGYKLRYAALKLYTPGGEQKIKSARLKNLKIGNANTGKVTVFCANMNHINKALVDSGEEPVQALLGADMLTIYSALIDIKNSRLYLKVD